MELIKKTMSSSKASLFIGGFLLMAMAHLFIKCEEYTGTPDDPGGEIVVDATQATKAAEAMEDAFISGKPEKVLEMLTPTALESYSDLISGSSSDILKAFGEAFKTRTLKLISERYAEFEFSADGKNYSVALSAGEDGTWKLMRL
jgi:hypothetical protein